jgi:hypothetical protein
MEDGFREPPPAGKQSAKTKLVFALSVLRGGKLETSLRFRMSLAMIPRLHERFGIAAEVPIRPRRHRRAA